MTISIVLVDDHPVVRRGMRSLLESEPGFSIMGEAADGREAVELAEQLQPDVMVLDLMMPGLSGLEALRTIRQHSPKTRPVVLSMYASLAFIAEALKNGAIGYVTKGCAEENLRCAVRAAAEGRRFLSPPVTEIAINAYIEQTKAGTLDPHDTLSSREHEVLQLVAEGKSSPEIASRLHISHRTVENHRANLMRKLDLHNQSDLFRFALRHGLLSLEE